MSQAWNADVTQTGTVLTARNLGWNGGLAPNASATFGFLVSGNGTATPTVACSVR